MNIVHVVENLNRGGLERVVINLALAQQAAGHAVRIVCLYEEGVLAPEMTGAGIPVDACNKQGGIDFAAIRRMRALIDAAKADILHTHNIVAHDYAWVASRGMAFKRFLNTRHGIGVAPKGRARHFAYLRSMRRTNDVVAVCEAARVNLVEKDRVPADRVVVVPNGILVDRFRAANADSHAKLAASIGVDASTRLIGAVGRLNWAKDFPTLIRAFASLRAKRDDVALVLVGDGALRAELTALADSEGVGASTHFLGDRGDVRELLPGFDVFAMSSVSEGYSIALLEASASALPIVATHVGGNAEIVRDGVSGRVVRPGDPAAFAAALGDVLADPARAATMGRAGFDWVRAYGSVAAMTAAYQAIYDGRRH